MKKKPKVAPETARIVAEILSYEAKPDFKLSDKAALVRKVAKQCHLSYYEACKYVD